jgi:hypothetical protein
MKEKGLKIEFVEPSTERIDFVSLIAMLEKAKENAKPLTEAEIQDEQESKLLSNFINGKISLKEYHEQDTRGQNLTSGEIELPSIPALLKAITYLIGDEELAQELVDHETDHYNEALRLGFVRSKIVLRFFTEDGDLSFRPGIVLALPDSGDEEQIRQHLKIIIEAPQELSDLDQKQISD